MPGLAAHARGSAGGWSGTGCQHGQAGAPFPSQVPRVLVAEGLGELPYLDVWGLTEMNMLGPRMAAVNGLAKPPLQ